MKAVRLRGRMLFVAGALFAVPAFAGPPTCKVVVDAAMKHEKGAKGWLQHRRAQLLLACQNAAWSAEQRACVAKAGDAEELAECNQAELARSPRKARCESLVVALVDRRIAALQKESPAAAEAYVGTKAEALRAETIHCATGPWSEEDLRCLEASTSSDADLACVQRHLFKKK